MSTAAVATSADELSDDVRVGRSAMTNTALVRQRRPGIGLVIAPSCISHDRTLQTLSRRENENENENEKSQWGPGGVGGVVLVEGLPTGCRMRWQRDSTWTVGVGFSDLGIPCKVKRATGWFLDRTTDA